MQKEHVCLTVSLDPGSSRYVVNPDAALIKRELSKHFELIEFRTLTMNHSPLAGTLLEIIIGGLAVGSGIVAAEFLKEAGKDLWKAFRTILLKPNEVRDYGKVLGVSGDLPDKGDDISIVIEVGNLTVRGHMRVRTGQEEQLQRFIAEGPYDLLSIAQSVQDGRGLLGNDSYTLQIESRKLHLRREGSEWVLLFPVCPNCRHWSRDVMQRPCSNCRHAAEKGGSGFGPNHGDHYEPVRGAKPTHLTWHRSSSGSGE
jgi:hypothetical protein